MRLARRGGVKFRFAAAVLLISGAALSFLSQMILTDRESIRNEFNGLARQISSREYDNLEAVLASDVIVHIGAAGEGAVWLNRRIRQKVDAGMDQLDVTAVELSNMVINLDGDTATVTFTVLLSTKQGGAPATEWSIRVERLHTDAGPSKVWIIKEIWAPSVFGVV